MSKKILLGMGAAMVVLASVSLSNAQVAGGAVTGVTVSENVAIAAGWSVKKKILGTNVYNAQNEKIGSVDDLIIAPDNLATFAIVGTGGFLGMAKHDVAIPIKNLKPGSNGLVLPGATKESLKALPEFEYAK